MPTGAGKSTVAKHILGTKYNLEPTSNQSGRALFTVHRRGLVDNAIETFKREPELPHGVIMSGRDTSPNERIQVASIDTALAWYVEGEYVSDFTFDLIVPDECHSHHSKYQAFIEA